MVSERTACDRLVGRLVSYGEPEGVRGRLGMGMFLLRRVYEWYLSGEAELVRFRSPHSRTNSSLAVQGQPRYTTKPRKSRVNSHYQNDKYTSNIRVLSRGGEGGIRTHGTVTRTTVFEF